MVLELDLLSNQAVEIIQRDPHGPAAASGLTEGDLIIAVNDRISETASEAFDYPDPLLWGPEGIDVILLGQGQVPAALPPPGRDRRMGCAEA